MHCSTARVSVVSHPSWKLLLAPPPFPSVADFSSEVVVVSVGLLVWSVLATIPHAEPFYPNLLLSLTLTAWWAPVWVLAIACAVLLLGLVVVSCCGVARPLRLWDLALAVTSLILFLTAITYVFVLNDRHSQDLVNGRLKL